MALDFESNPETLPEAIEVYERVVDLAPDWIEAHINLGVAYYQTGQISDACAAFRAAPNERNSPPRVIKQIERRRFVRLQQVH